MLSRSVTCYVLQRNIASTMNKYSYGQKVFIEDRRYAATEKVLKWYAESKRLGIPALEGSEINLPLTFNCVGKEIGFAGFFRSILLKYFCSFQANFENALL